MPEERKPMNLGEVILAVVLIGGFGVLPQCSNMMLANRIEQLNGTIEKKLSPQPQTLNVIGRDASDKFYEIDGQRAYLEIDGKSVEHYFGEKR